MYKKVAIFVSFGIIFFCIGFFTGSTTTGNKYEVFLNSISLKRDNNKNYPLVHPILGFSSSNAAGVNQFTSLTERVKAVFAANKSIVGRYSVYFRDQNKGLWFGINEDDKYDPASMLKVALAIAAYKEAQMNPGFLYEQKIYTPEFAQINNDIAYSLPSELKVNHGYGIEDLIEKMIVDSDNGAKDIIANSIDPKIIDDVYTNLSIDQPQDGQGYVISSKKYTSFFRTLYNATYLNQEYSNKLLGLLSKATFDEALVAGVPSDITVSHKYGEHVNDTNNTKNSVELHDCGVVYLPEKPYILCIMTEGTNELGLAKVIASVSKVIYESVSTDYK